MHLEPSPSKSYWQHSHSESRENPSGRDALLQVLGGGLLARALITAATLGIADHIGEAEVVDVEALAQRIKAHPDALSRLMGSLAGAGIFVEREPRFFAHTAASLCLRTDSPDSLRHLLRIHDIEAHYRAWGDLTYSVRTGRDAFQRVTGQQCFTYLMKHPAEADIFFKAMGDYTRFIADRILASYDFSGVSTLIDLGGAHGDMLGAILQRYPAMRGSVFDLPSSTAGAEANFLRLGVGDRATALGGSFLDEVPQGADAYILKYCLHDWDDGSCIKILSNARNAMARGGRVLIIEMIIPDRSDAFLGKLFDLEALVITPGGRERTESEYQRICAAAGLEIVGRLPVDACTSVIDCRAPTSSQS